MNRILVEKIRKVYTQVLLESLKEVDVVDTAGNVLISKDLKVVHKDSGYEYTVDDIVKQGDEIGIVLRHPDEPRFEPPASTDLLDELDKQLDKFILGDDLIAVDIEDAKGGDLFVVDEKSFEKEYEIK